jgi:hypothetical protein
LEAGYIEVLNSSYSEWLIADISSLLVIVNPS